MKTICMAVAGISFITAFLLLTGCNNDGNVSGTRPETANIASYPVSDYDLGNRALKGGPQIICPIKGFPINKELYTDYQGKRIYFCCPGCDKKFLKDPEKYMKQMKDAGIVLENSPLK